MLPFPRPLDLLVVTDGGGKAADRLASLGAAVNAVAYDNATAVMKYGIRAADAVVIEESGNDLSSIGAVRLANIARAIHELPGPVAMPNGARWNGIPIIALVDYDDVADALHLDLPYVVACATENLFYWDYIDPWPDIYERIDHAVYENKLARMEEMQRLGFRFQLLQGRYLRLIPPNPRRRNGAFEDIETPLYSGLHDVLLRRRRDAEDHWTARDVMWMESAASERDFYEFERLLKHARTEPEMQIFYERRSQMLGDGVFDTFAHPMLRNIEAVRYYPDFIQRSFNDGIAPKPARIIELKRPDAEIIVPYGSHVRQSKYTSTGVMQTHDYGEIVIGEHYADQIAATLGERPYAIEKLVVVGQAGKHDRHLLDQVRKWEPYVEVRGHDEVYDDALARFVR